MLNDLQNVLRLNDFKVLNPSFSFSVERTDLMGPRDVEGIIAWCVDFPVKGVSRIDGLAAILSGWVLNESVVAGVPSEYTGLYLRTASGEILPILFNQIRPDAVKAVLGSPVNAVDRCGFNVRFNVEMGDHYLGFYRSGDFVPMVHFRCCS